MHARTPPCVRGGTHATAPQCPGVPTFEKRQQFDPTMTSGAFYPFAIFEDRMHACRPAPLRAPFLAREPACLAASLFRLGQPRRHACALAALRYATIPTCL